MRDSMKSMLSRSPWHDHVNKYFGVARPKQSNDHEKINEIYNDEQITLMNKLLVEMALLRRRFAELQNDEPGDPVARDVARERSGDDIFGGRNDTVELLLKSLTKIRHLMKETEQCIRQADHDAV
jgi:hypothetical protein